MDKLIPDWNDKYTIDDPKIDAEHKKLFEIAEKVESNIFKHVNRDEYKEILNELFSYMKEHFSNEERYMQEINYPYLNEHRAMHKTIIQEMSYLILHIKTTNDLKEKLYTIISKWLLEHILRHDMMIGTYLKKSKAEEMQDFAEPQPEDNQQKNTEEPVFIYTCSCHTKHKLDYSQHIDILYHQQNMQCKKCLGDLHYVDTTKDSDAS